jgi:hypothetical protein
VQQRSVHDRRSLPVRLTAKGPNLRNRLSDMHQRNSDTIDQIGVSEPDLRRVVAMLRRLEQFWIEAATRLEAVPGSPP